MSYIRPPFVLLFLLFLVWRLSADGPGDPAFVDASPPERSPREVLR